MSPQFHVVIDDNFSTVPSLRAGTVPDNWQQLVCNSREKSTDGFYDVTKTWLSVEEDISADTTINQAINSVNSSPDGNSNNLLQAKKSVHSIPDIAATPAIDSDYSCPDVNATQDIESDNSCSDDTTIPSQG